MTDTTTPTERAALLGIDYAALQAGGRRVWSGMVVVLAAWVVGAGGVVGVWAVWRSESNPFGLPASLLGLAVGFLAGLLPSLLVSILFQMSRFTSAHGVRQQVAACAGAAAMGVLFLALAVLFVPVQGYLGLALGFSVIGPLVPILSQTQLKKLIDGNNPKLGLIVNQWREAPASQTILGGTVRWIVAAFAIGLVEFTGLAVLILALPALVLPVLVLRFVFFGAVEWLAHTRAPMVGAMVYGGFAVAVVSAGVAAVALR
jgi:hypothetical protein